MRADGIRSSTFGSLFSYGSGWTERNQQKSITCTLTKKSTSAAGLDGSLLSALRQPVTLHAMPWTNVLH